MKRWISKSNSSFSVIPNFCSSIPKVCPETSPWDLLLRHPPETSHWDLPLRHPPETSPRDLPLIPPPETSGSTLLVKPTSCLANPKVWLAKPKDRIHSKPSYRFLNPKVGSMVPILFTSNGLMWSMRFGLTKPSFGFELRVDVKNARTSIPTFGFSIKNFSQCSDNIFVRIHPLSCSCRSNLHLRSGIKTPTHH